MSIVYTDSDNYTAIANAIRAKNGSADTYTPAQMATAISNIPSGGSVLPAEYQEVEWIGSSGTQRIETGIINNTANIPVSYETTISYSDVTTRQLNGSQGAFYFGVVSGYWQLGQGGSNHSSISAISDEWNSVTIGYSGVSGTARNIIATINGAEYQSSNTQSFDFNNAYNVCLFSMNGQNLPSSCKIKATKIYQKYILVRNLIPCYRIADSVIGMYDIVNDVFYQNAGTGTFTKGADV